MALHQTVASGIIEGGFWSANGGQTWRRFYRHYPTGAIYVLEQDSAIVEQEEEQSFERVSGPYPLLEVTWEQLAAAELRSEGEGDFLDWADVERWDPLTPLS